MDWNKWQESPKSKCTPRDMFSYYTATREGAPGERHLFSISDSGGWPQILTMLILSFHFYQKLLLYLKGIITLSITLINLIGTSSWSNTKLRHWKGTQKELFIVYWCHSGGSGYKIWKVHKKYVLQQDLFDMTMVTKMFDTKSSESESFIDRTIVGTINIMMEFTHF